MGGGWTAHPRHLLLCGGVSLHPCTAYTTTVVVAVVFIVVSTTTVTHGWRLEHPNERSGGVRVCLLIGRTARGYSDDGEGQSGLGGSKSELAVVIRRRGWERLRPASRVRATMDRMTITASTWR